MRDRNPGSMCSVQLVPVKLFYVPIDSVENENWNCGPDSLTV